MLRLVPMTEAHLPVVGRWLEAEHVARWWLTDTTARATLETYRARALDARSPTKMLIVSDDGEPVGFCQFYRWRDYPDEAVLVGATDDAWGFDYCLGDVGRIGRGLGSDLVGLLVDAVLTDYPGGEFVVDPAAENVASCRVLEKNGFVATGHTSAGHAVYRRPAG